MSEPIGQPFTRVYRERGAPTRDSKTFRVRLQAYFVAQLAHDGGASRIRSEIALHGGISMRSPGGGDWGAVEAFLVEAPVEQILDSITYVYLTLAHPRIPGESTAQRRWREFVSTAMREENVAHRVDVMCGVHHFVDEEFERNRVATVAVLEHETLTNARSNFEDAYRHLDRGELPQAVRSIFMAAEAIAKQICPAAQNLSKKLVENDLKQRCIATMVGDDTEKKTLALAFDSIGDWVNALHNYRHAQASDEPVTPSEDLAVLALSTGSAYVRLLGACYLRMQESA